MKKQISVLLSIIMLCSILILPVSAYTTVDYSCYIGEWAGNMVSSEGWSNDAKISITQAENATSTEPASISFSFSYRQPVSYTHLDVYKRQYWHRRKFSIPFLAC